MKTVLLTLFFTFTLVNYSHSFDTYRISQGVSIKKYLIQKDDSINWLVIHNDEVDALAAMKWAIREYGGAGYEVSNLNRSNKRILKEFKGKIFFSYDPNRIFTDIGIEKTLAHYNRHFRKIYKMGYHMIKYQIRKGFLKWLPFKQKSYLIALHNNDKKSSISVTSYYRKKGFFIFRNPKEHIKNFVIVTKRKDFEILMKNGINVVWQYEVNPENNDGSLSIYCYQNKYPYINIESRYNDAESQKRMIQCIIKKIVKKTEPL